MSFDKSRNKIAFTWKGHPVAENEEVCDTSLGLWTRNRKKNFVTGPVNCAEINQGSRQYVQLALFFFIQDDFLNAA